MGELGVSSGTIGKWERGDMRPTRKNINTLRESIPTGLDEEEIVDDIELTREWHGRITSRERRIFGSNKLQLLRKKLIPARSSPLKQG